MSPVPTAIRSRHLQFEYPSGRTGVAGLDLDVNAGEIVVALGPNGSGKSTLLRLLATDLAPCAGSIELLGRRVGGHRSRRDLRRRIAYASDTPVHVPWLSGGEHARFMVELAGRSWREERAAVRALLSGFGLDEVLDVSVSAYSFGMRRKLLLVEAIAVRPDLLLLDEPTVGLDSPGEEALRSAVDRVTGRGGAVVIASNETRSLPRWADRILLLHRGRLVQEASPDALYERLRGHTRIEIDFTDMAAGPADRPILDDVPGVRICRWDGKGIRVESSRGGAPLPALLEALLSSGRSVHDVRVREPDLGDLFLELTGAPLASQPSGGEPAEPARPSEPVSARK